MAIIGCTLVSIGSWSGKIPVLGSFFRGSSGSIVSLSGLYNSLVVIVLYLLKSNSLPSTTSSYIITFT